MTEKETFPPTYIPFRFAFKIIEFIMCLLKISNFVLIIYCTICLHIDSINPHMVANGPKVRLGLIATLDDF